MDDQTLLLRYLHLPPWEALIQMVNDRYALELFLDTTMLVASDPLPGGAIEVTIAVNRSKSLANLLPPMEQRTFIIDRLDLGEYFPQGLILRARDLSSHPTTLDVVNVIMTRNPELSFSGDDILHEELVYQGETLNYVLQAHPRSLRWFGETPIVVLP